MNYSHEIKNAVSARDCFEFYGFPVNRSGFVCCPLHGEDTPSLKVYSGNRGWHCYGCNEGGSVIDFVMVFFGLSFADAQKKINDDFQLGLPIGETLTVEKRREMEKRWQEVKLKQEERRKRRNSLLFDYRRAFDRWAILDTIKRECAPKTPSEGLSAAFAYALQNIDKAEYDLGIAETRFLLFEMNENTDEKSA